MSDAYSLFHLLQMARLKEQMYNSEQEIMNAQAQQTCCMATTGDFATLYADGITQATIVQPYNPPVVLHKEPAKMKIDPKEFKYNRYTNDWDHEINDEEVRDRMTDYWFKSFDPLQVCEITEHYYLAGPDPKTNPTKRKFYNGSKWFQQFWDGKHGQTKDVEIVRHDISDPMWQELVVAMVVSGDFTLQQALYAVAVACDRCRHALLYKYREYHTYCDQGYSEESKEYQNSYAGCKFCRY